MAEFFRIMRVRPNGTEVLVKDVTIADVTAEQQLRAQAYADGRAARSGGQHYRVYTSSGETIVPARDLVWDSEVND